MTETAWKEAAIVSYAASLEKKVSELRSLFSALQDTPADPGARERLRTAFHRIHGSAGSYEFDELGDLAGQCEALMDVTARPGAPLDESVLAAVGEGLDRFARLAADLAGRTTAQPLGAAGPPRLLVIEDDDQSRVMMQRTLEREGFAVAVAGTTGEALRHLETFRPDALIIDIFLGEQSGLELLENLRRNGDRRPMIVVSILDGLSNKLDATRRGCDAYFEKPIDWDALVRKLRRLIRAGDDPPSHRILVVDDDPHQRTYLAELLTERGYDVDLADDVGSIDRALSRARPDLVILDIRLPDASGYEIARYLRKDDRFAPIPIIFLTADQSEISEVRSIAAGGDDHMRKPVNPDLLLTSVAARLDRSITVQSLMEHEGLTGLLTRAAFEGRAAAMVAERRRSATPLSMVLLDLDRFKSINDRFGHSAGDRVLVALGALLRRRLRESDLTARYGGEEFALLLNSDEPAAVRIVQELLGEFASVAHSCENGETFTATFSAGVAALSDGASVEDLKTQADRALYEAKRRGRSRVLSASTIETDPVLDPSLLQPLLDLQQRTAVPLVAELRELFFDGLEQRLEAIRTAVENGDAAAAELAVHSFHSSALNLGAARLASTCSRLESLVRARDLERARPLVPELIREARLAADALTRVQAP